MACDYLRKAFDPAKLRSIAKQTARLAKNLNADVVVARGLSGIVVATVVGAVHNIPFAIVRKPNEGSHSNEAIEISSPIDDAWQRPTHNNWLIVDDFIASGNTIREINKAINNEYYRFKGICVGIVLYNEPNSDSIEHMVGDVTAPIFRITP